MAARYVRRLPLWWVDRHDVEQEAMVAAHDARRTFDPEHGSRFSSYAFRACVLHVRKFLFRQSAPVSAPETAFEELRGLRRIELEDLHGDPAPWADALLVDEDWKFRVHEQLDFVLRSRQGDKSSVTLRMLLDDEKPRDLADELGMKRGDVYRLAQRGREALARNALLFDLLKEIDQ